MVNEIYKALRSINILNLSLEDQYELLIFFRSTNNAIIRNQLSFMFADLQYREAVPYIIKKINQKKNFNNNGSLVFALQSFDLKDYFIEIIKIICEQGYEARLQAFGIAEEYISKISTEKKREALALLEQKRLKLEINSIDQGQNSPLHFIEQTIKLLIVK